MRLKARFVSFDAQTRVLVVRRGAHTFSITVPAGFALPSLQANQKVDLMALRQGGQFTLVALKAQTAKAAPAAPVTQNVRFSAKFVSFNAQTRTLTVTRGGLTIAIAVPAGITVPALAANAKLQITASLQNGQLTLVALNAGPAEDDD